MSAVPIDIGKWLSSLHHYFLVCIKTQR